MFDIQALLQKVFNEMKELDNGNLYLFCTFFSEDEWDHKLRGNILLLADMFLNKKTSEILEFMVSSKIFFDQQKCRIIRRNSYA